MNRIGYRCATRARRIIPSPRHRAEQLRVLTATARCSESGISDNRSVDVEELLAKPTWSVSKLMPPKDMSSHSAISSKQLHHLLRLSALPPPKSDEEEHKMLSTLSSQLHFVKEIQKVDTNGIEPLRSIRNETAAGEREMEVGLRTMADAFGREDVIGKYHKRIRRRNEPRAKDEEGWDVLGTAGRKSGRYFVVEGGKND